MLMQRNSTLLAKMLRMKPPLTSNAPAIEVTLVPSLAQATEAMGLGHSFVLLRFIVQFDRNIYMQPLGMTVP
ncbi:hypothetical protein EYF80_006860 [Liparis tanakae]|uniref:Uncharacterized protein n=1 Tax=Liparis tanakae TaxID=230148 RepID=A0A4Z2J0D0_9TELE|nr:hypothetical protein EYF80_006860 [Liparis tanakae]